MDKWIPTLSEDNWTGVGVGAFFSISLLALQILRHRHTITKSTTNQDSTTLTDHTDLTCLTKAHNRFSSELGTSHILDRVDEFRHQVAGHTKEGE